MSVDDLALYIEEFTKEKPSGRVLQELRDRLTQEAFETMRQLVEETLP